MKRVAFFRTLVLGLTLVSVGQSQPAAGSIKVEIGGKLTEMSVADLAKLPRKEVTGKDHDGKESTFSGVEIREILTAAGAKLGADIRGKRLAEYLLVEAADGYRAVYAIAELDPEFAADVVILADKQDGKLLDEKKGKFQVIAPADKRHGRWVRQVTKLSLRIAGEAAVDNKRAEAEDLIRARAFSEFLSFSSKLDSFVSEPSTIYLGVNGYGDPSTFLISKLSTPRRQIRNASETGPLRADGSFVEGKKATWTITLSPVKWIDPSRVEVGISGHHNGISCTYVLVKKSEIWELQAEKSCVVSVDIEHP